MIHTKHKLFAPEMFPMKQTSGPLIIMCLETCLRRKKPKASVRSIPYFFPTLILRANQIFTKIKE